MTLTIGSLCSGYGGLDLGVQQVLDARVAWHCEFAAAPSKILAHHWPDVPNHRDLTTTDWAAVEPVDIITAGWPCQPWSLAGKGKGADDERAIWPAIANAVRALRPRYVFLENVAAVVVLGELARAVGDLARLGYDAQWQCLRASEVGAPHGRNRCFIVAADAEHRADNRERSRTEPGRGGAADADASGTGAGRHAGPVPRAASEIGREDVDVRAAGHGRSGAGVAQDSDGAARGERGFAAPRQAQGGRSRADAGRRGGAPTADASHDGRERGQELHGGSTAGVEASHGHHADGRGHAAANTDGKGLEGPRAGRRGSAQPEPLSGSAATTDTKGNGRHEGRPEPAGVVGGSDAAECGADVQWGVYEPAIRRWERASLRPAPRPTEPGSRGGQRLSARFVEFLMGLPAGHVTDVPGLSRNDQLKALGNGVVPAQAAAAYAALLGATALAVVA